MALQAWKQFHCPCPHVVAPFLLVVNKENLPRRPAVAELTELHTESEWSGQDHSSPPPLRKEHGPNGHNLSSRR